MDDLSLALALIFIPTFILGQIEHVRASPEKIAWYKKLLTQMKELDARHYTMALFIGCMFLISILSIIIKTTEWKLPTFEAVAILTATCLSAALYLSVLLKKYIAKIAKYKTSLNIAWGALALCLLTASKIASDMLIANLTTLPPEELPGAQMMLTLVLQPTLWLVTISIFLGYFSIPATIFALCLWIAHEIKTNNSQKPSFLSATYICVIIAMLVTFLIIITMTRSILSPGFYEKRIRTAIVFSAFHLPPSYCGLTDTEGATIAQLKDSRAALAIPDKDKGYEFSILLCTPKLKSKEELESRLADRKEEASNTN